MEYNVRAWPVVFIRERAVVSRTVRIRQWLNRVAVDGVLDPVLTLLSADRKNRSAITRTQGPSKWAFIRNVPTPKG